MKLYYYISGTMGMKSNGSFTRDKSQWMTFTEDDVQRCGYSGKPYGATKLGLFISTEKYW